MLTIYDECISLINQLNYSDKLRLAQWLMNVIATEKEMNNIVAIVDELSNEEQQDK